jgi:Ser/Thr protein kinase RdoA (MazF antagonist)
MTEDDATALAAVACSAWPIITAQPRLVMHRENTVFQVDTSQGPHALRMHRYGYHSPSTILSELQWMHMLTTKDFVVPSPVLSQEGSFLVTCNDENGLEHVFSLLSWLSGEAFGKSALPLRFIGTTRTAVMTEIGRNLARLHILSDTWSLPADFTRPAWDHDGLLGETPFWGRFWEAEFVSDNERHALLALRTTCQSALSQYDEESPDSGLIHADLARENILVDGERVSFIDFDDSGYGYRMFDIATALIKNIHEPDYENLKHALLQGYRAERPLRPHDLQVLPLFMLLRSLTYLGWVDARIAEPGMVEKSRRFLADVKYLAGAYSNQFPSGP